MRIFRLLAPALVALGLVTPALPQTAPQPIQLNLGGGPNDRSGAPARTLFQQLQGGVNGVIGSRGTPNGFAGLDANGLVPVAQLPLIGALNATPAGKRAVEQGQADDLTATGVGQIARTLSSIANDTLNVKAFGAIGDGQSHPLSQRFATLAAAQLIYPAATALTDEIDWAAAQLAANTVCTRASGYVVYPQGTFFQNRTVDVTCDGTKVSGVAEDAVRIVRRGDFGPTFRFAKKNGYLQGVGLRNMWLIDNEGSMTTANSPFHIYAEGITRSNFVDINISEGAGALELAGGDQITVRNFYAYFSRGAPGSRVGVRIGPSSNGALGATPVGISDVWLHHVNIKGGIPTAANDGYHLSFGIQAFASDGLWISDSHVQGTSSANFNLRRSTTAGLGNVYVTNFMSDLCNLHGILIDGTYPIQRVSIEGWVSGGQTTGDANAGGNGVYLTGPGGASDLTLSVGVDGHKLDGIKVDAQNVIGTTIQPKQILALGGAGSVAIDLLSGARYSIAGGLIDGNGMIGLGLRMQGVVDATVTGLGITRTLGNGFQIGDGSSYISMSGGQSSRNTGFGGAISSGTNFVSVTGMLLANNTAGALQNNAAAGAFVLTANNLGM